MNELMDSLKGQGRYVARMAEEGRKLSEDDVFWVLFARSEAHAQGLTYENEPDLAAFDRLLLAHAQELTDAVGTFEYERQDPRRASVGARPFRDDHWWWYLDEILAGDRQRPEVP